MYIKTFFIVALSDKKNAYFKIRYHNWGTTKYHMKWLFYEILYKAVQRKMCLDEFVVLSDWCSQSLVQKIINTEWPSKLHCFVLTALAIYIKASRKQWCCLQLLSTYQGYKPMVRRPNWLLKRTLRFLYLTPKLNKLLIFIVCYPLAYH